MSDVTNTTINEVYNKAEKENPGSEVARIIVVLMPRAVMAAGFDINGSLITAQRTAYDNSDSPWILDFFENQFMHNPLLQNTKKVIAAFIADEQSMLVPNALYDEHTAINWMKSLYFIEGSETVSSYNINNEGAWYLSAWPASVKSLFWRYFPTRKILPLAAYQFKQQTEYPNLIHCCIYKGKVAATLYSSGKLQWHQIFKYHNAEDIAYQLKLLIQLHLLENEELQLQVSSTGPEMNETINFLTQYFPQLREGNGDKEMKDKTWMATAYLLEQLYTCAL